MHIFNLITLVAFALIICALRGGYGQHWARARRIRRAADLAQREIKSFDANRSALREATKRRAT